MRRVALPAGQRARRHPHPRQLPARHLEPHPHLAGQARAVRAGQPAGRAAPAAAAQRPQPGRGAQGRRRPPRTMREQLELHRAKPACAGCHARMDPHGPGAGELRCHRPLARDESDGGGASPSTPRGTLVTGEPFPACTSCARCWPTPARAVLPDAHPQAADLRAGPRARSRPTSARWTAGGPAAGRGRPAVHAAGGIVESPPVPAAAPGGGAMTRRTRNTAIDSTATPCSGAWAPACCAGWGAGGGAAALAGAGALATSAPGAPLRMAFVGVPNGVNQDALAAHRRRARVRAWARPSRRWRRSSASCRSSPASPSATPTPWATAAATTPAPTPPS